MEILIMTNIAYPLNSEQNEVFRPDSEFSGYYPRRGLSTQNFKLEPHQNQLSTQSRRKVAGVGLLVIGAIALLAGVIAMKKNLCITPFAKQIAAGGGVVMLIGSVPLLCNLIHYIGVDEVQEDYLEEFTHTT